MFNLLSFMPCSKEKQLNALSQEQRELAYERKILVLEASKSHNSLLTKLDTLMDCMRREGVCVRNPAYARERHASDRS